MDGEYPDDGDNSRPDDDNLFSNGNNTEGGTEEIVDGADEDSAAISTRRTVGESSFNADGDDDTAVKRAVSSAGDNASHSCGVADNAFATDAIAEGGKRPSVVDVHNAVNRDATESAFTGLAYGFGSVCNRCGTMEETPSEL